MELRPVSGIIVRYLPSLYPLRPTDSLTPLRLIQILSLDVVLGACVSTVFVAQFVAAPISFASLVALAICVWLIYTADHLLDAYRLGKKVAHTARHRYHQTRFRAIAVAWGVVALLGVGVLFFLTPRLIYYGLLLTAGVGVYFALTQYTTWTQWLPKEFITALLYTTGVFLPSLAVYESPLYWNLGVLFFQYFFLALGNLLLFSWFETDIDQQDGHESFARRVGRPLTYNMVLLCLAAVVASTVLMLILITTSSTSLAAQLTVLTMGLVLLVIAWRPDYFRPDHRYRWLGDGIFLLPIIPLLLL